MISYSEYFNRPVRKSREKKSEEKPINLLEFWKSEPNYLLPFDIQSCSEEKIFKVLKLAFDVRDETLDEYLGKNFDEDFPKILDEIQKQFFGCEEGNEESLYVAGNDPKFNFFQTIGRFRYGVLIQRMCDYLFEPVDTTPVEEKNLIEFQKKIELLYPDPKTYIDRVFGIFWYTREDTQNSSTDFYNKLMNKRSAKPEEVLFFDDSEEKQNQPSEDLDDESIDNEDFDDFNKKILQRQKLVPLCEFKSDKEEKKNSGGNSEGSESRFVYIPPTRGTTRKKLSAVP